CARKEDALDVW
nr:immunoglobulin heavy chain junction region [Macaca mulatta]